MDPERILGCIVILFFSGGFGFVSYGIGLWAERKQEPMGFWTGREVDSSTITDIAGYNRANGRMWKLYSIPFLMTIPLGIGSLWFAWCSAAVFMLIMLDSTLGIWWLICRYRRICREFMRNA